VTIACAGSASDKVSAWQISTTSSPADSSKSIPAVNGAPAQASNDDMEQTEPGGTNLLRFADAPVNSTFYFAQGLREDLWLKSSTNSARRLAGGDAVQIDRDATVLAVSQGVDYYKVPLHSTFYFLPDTKQVRPWIKTSRTTATNPRDGKTYVIRNGLVSLANSPLHNNTSNCPAYSYAD
jgi:hypothetical protein